jgi:hypothetical protein
LHELVGICVLVNHIVWLPHVICAGVNVNGSALVFCGRDMWFLGGRNVCAIFFVYLQFWCDNPLEQVLAGTPSHFYHGQVKTGVRRSCKVWNGVLGW